MVEDRTEADQLSLKAEIDTLFEEAYRLRESEQWGRMLELAARGRELSERIGYRRGLAFAFGIVAFVHYIQSSLHLALDETMQGLALADGDIVVEARLRGLLAILHWSLGNYDEMTREGNIAFEQYRRAGLKLDEAFSYLARGGMSHTLGDFDAARLDHEQAVELFVQIGSKVGLGRSYAGLASALTELGETDRARDCLLRALECARETRNQLVLSRVLNDFGLLELKLKRMEEAKAHFEEALHIREQGGYRPAAITSLLDLGRLHIRTGDLDKAILYAARAEAEAFELGARPKLADAHQLLCQIHEQRGNLAEALHRLRAYQELREQINGEQSRLRAETFRLMNQIQTLRAQQAEQLNSEKLAAVGSLVAALTHEMNSPLGAIRSAADTTARAANKLLGNGIGEVLRSNARVMTEATDRISITVNRLKGFAGLDLAEYRQANLLAGIEDALAILAPKLGDQIVVERKFCDLPLVSCYAAEINQVFLHLLRNAVESIDGSGRIAVSSECRGNEVRIEIADTGRGIPQERMPKLFDPSFNDRGQRVRASLSLFSCFSIVKRHGGELNVRSREGAGTTFTVVLPLNVTPAT